MPFIGQMVHYVNQEGEHCAAIITASPAAGTSDQVRLVVFTADANPAARLAKADPSGQTPETWHEIEDVDQAQVMRHRGGQG